jgi:hypothetical protein
MHFSAQFPNPLNWHSRNAAKPAGQQGKSLTAAIKNVVRRYKACGLNVLFMIMVGEFEPIHGELNDLGVSFNTASNNECVGDIECYICTLKEQFQSICKSGQLIIGMVYKCFLAMLTAASFL